MGALPAIKRLLVDDFPKQADWIGNLLYPLNQLINSIFSNFNNGLTISQNMLAQINTLEVKGSSPTTSFQWKFASAPIGINVINVAISDGSGTPILGAVSCQWSYSAGQITISNVTGLNAASTYNVTFHVIGG